MKTLVIQKPYKAIVSKKVDYDTMALYLVFYYDYYETVGGHVFLYSTEKSAQLDIAYLVNHVKEICEEDVELVQISFNELFSDERN